MRNYLMAVLGLVLTAFFTLHAESWKPDYLLIGAQKSGTTVLQALINQHPLVLKKKAEIHFFDKQFFRSVEWYKKQFPKRPDPSYIIGDKTPYYMFHPYVAERVHSLYPDMKLIVILRNPVDRAYSQYWHNIGKKQETLTFEDALKAEEKRLRGEVEKLKDPNHNTYTHRISSYLSRGIYVDQLKRWLSYFPREQLLVLSQEMLRNEPQKVLNKVFDFLEIPRHSIVVKHPKKHGHYPPMKRETREQLNEYFRPYNQQLETLLDMNFHW